uniref:tenascin-X-like n=1 Tax=Myxine glutinosa TaxID=7769 RepID=UPI00358F9A00
MAIHLNTQPIDGIGEENTLEDFIFLQTSIISFEWQYHCDIAFYIPNNFAPIILQDTKVQLQAKYIFCVHVGKEATHEIPEHLPTMAQEKKVNVTVDSEVPSESAEDVRVTDITPHGITVPSRVDPLLVKFATPDKPEQITKDTDEVGLPVDTDDITEDAVHKEKPIPYPTGKPSDVLETTDTTGVHVGKEATHEISEHLPTMAPEKKVNVTVDSEVPPESAEDVSVTDITPHGITVPSRIDPLLVKFATPDKPEEITKDTDEVGLPVDTDDITEDTVHKEEPIPYPTGKPSDVLETTDTTGVHVGKEATHEISEHLPTMAPEKKVNVTVDSEVPPESAEDVSVTDITPHGITVPSRVDPLLVKFATPDKPEQITKDTDEVGLPVDTDGITEDTAHKEEPIPYPTGKPSDVLETTDTTGVHVGKEATHEIPEHLPTMAPEKKVNVTVDSEVPPESAEDVRVTDITPHGITVPSRVDPLLVKFATPDKPEDITKDTDEVGLPVDTDDITEDTVHKEKPIPYPTGKPSDVLETTDTTAQEIDVLFGKEFPVLTPRKEITVTSSFGVPHHPATKISAYDVTGQGFTVLWKVSPSIFDKFHFSYKPSDSSEELKTVVIPGHRTALCLTSLKEDTEYVVSLVGFQNGKPSHPLSLKVRTGVLFPSEILEKIKDHVTTVLPEKDAVTSQLPPLSATGLRISDITTNSMKVTWKFISQVFDKFIISYKPKNSTKDPKEVEVRGEEDMVVLPQLTEDTQYLVKVTGYKKGIPSVPLEATATTGVLFPSEILEKIKDHVTTVLPEKDAVTSQLPPLSATGLRISDITTNSMMVTWKFISQVFDKFIISYKPKDSTKDPKEVEVRGEEDMVVLPQLTEDTQYLVKVTGYKKGIPSVALEATATTGLKLLLFKNFVALKHVFSFTCSLTIVDTSTRFINTQMHLGQHPIIRITIYDMLVVDVLEHFSDCLADTVERVCNASHMQQVREEFLQGVLFPSEILEKIKDHVTTVLPEKDAVTSQLPPLSATGLRISDITTNSMMVTWKFISQVFDKFIISYKPKDSTKDPKEVEVRGEEDMVVLPQLTEDTQYLVKVTGYKKGIPSVPLEATATTGVLFPSEILEKIKDHVTTVLPEKDAVTSQLPPLSATGLRISDITTNSMMVTWKFISQVFDKFIISYKPKDSTKDPKEVEVRGEEDMVVLPQLTEDTQYLVKVTGYKKGIPSVALEATATTGLKLLLFKNFVALKHVFSFTCSLTIVDTSTRFINTQMHLV